MPSAMFEEFARGLERVHGRFVEATDDERAREAVLAILTEAKAKRIALWDDPLLKELGLPEALKNAGMELSLPGPNAVKDAAAADAGLTSALAGLRATGSLVVHAGPGRPRSFSLLPPLHLALLPGSALRQGTRDLPAIFRSVGEPPSAMHVITGPSSTADIELIKVHGVHGPIELVVLGLSGR